MNLVTSTDLFTSGTIPYIPATAPGPRPENDIRQWARAQVEKVRVAALSGRFRYAPPLDDLTEETPEIKAAYPTMLKDGTIRAGLMTKVLAVAQLPAQIQVRDKQNPRDQECGEFVRYALDKIESAQNWMGIPGIAWNVLGPACVQGVSVANKVWADQPESVGRFKGKRIYSRLKAKDPARLRLLTDDFKNLRKITAPHFNGGEEFDPADFVIYSHLSWYENPNGSSDFRAAYGPFYRKRVVMDLWSLHLDKFTGGMLRGTYTDADQKAELRAALEEARSDTWIMVPQGTLVEAMQLAVGGESEEFEKFCRYQDEQSLIAIVGAYLHILTGQVSDARGDTGIAKETSELFQWMLAATLAGTIQKQLVVPLVIENYADVEPPGITLGSISDAAMLQRANLYEILQRVGFKPSAEEGYNFFSLTQAADEADTLVPPVQAPAPGGFGFAEGGEADEPIPFRRRLVAR